MSKEVWIYRPKGDPEYYFEGLDTGVKSIKTGTNTLIIKHHNGARRKFVNIPFEIVEESK